MTLFSVHGMLSRQFFLFVYSHFLVCTSSSLSLIICGPIPAMYLLSGVRYSSISLSIWVFLQNIACVYISYANTCSITPLPLFWIVLPSLSTNFLRCIPVVPHMFSSLLLTATGYYTVQVFYHFLNDRYIRVWPIPCFPQIEPW